MYDGRVRRSAIAALLFATACGGAPASREDPAEDSMARVGREIRANYVAESRRQFALDHGCTDAAIEATLRPDDRTDVTGCGQSDTYACSVDSWPGPVSCERTP